MPPPGGSQLGERVFARAKGPFITRLVIFRVSSYFREGHPARTCETQDTHTLPSGNSLIRLFVDGRGGHGARGLLVLVARPPRCGSHTDMRRDMACGSLIKPGHPLEISLSLRERGPCIISLLSLFVFRFCSTPTLISVHTGWPVGLAF